MKQFPWLRPAETLYNSQWRRSLHLIPKKCHTSENRYPTLLPHGKTEKRIGFSLIEILLSLLILSGTLVTLLGGFQVALELDKHAQFEEMAAYFAEREMEIAKCDLLSGKAVPDTATRAGRFRLPKGWGSWLSCAPLDEFSVSKILCRVARGSETLTLESFLYCPEKPGVSGVRN